VQDLQREEPDGWVSCSKISTDGSKVAAPSPLLNAFNISAHPFNLSVAENVSASGCTPRVVLGVAGVLLGEAESAVGNDDDSVGGCPNFTSGSPMQ
jgi:hypothetical protein